MFFERTSNLRRWITYLHALWLVCVGFCAFAVSENMAFNTLGLSTWVFGNEVAIPLLILSSSMVVLASEYQPHPRLRGFNVGFHLLFCIAAVPFLIIMAMAGLEDISSLICVLAVAAACLAPLLPSRPIVDGMQNPY